MFLTESNKSYSAVHNIEMEYKDRLLKMYESRFNDVAKAKGDFKEDEAIRLGILLDNINEAFGRHGMLLNEATSNPNFARGLKTFYYDIVTASMPALISEELFSIQPMRQKFGQIFFLQYILSSNKGKIKAGTVLTGPNEYVGLDIDRYADAEVNEEQVGTHDNSTTTFNSQLAWLPIIPGSVTIETSDGKFATDDGKGKIKGDDLSGESSTIDYNTGKIKLVFSSAKPDGQEILATYTYDNENGSVKTPELELKIVDMLIKARSKKLSTKYNFDAAFDVNRAHGINVEDELLFAAASTLRQDLDAELINLCFQQAQHKVTYKLKIDTNQSTELREHLDSLVLHLTRSASIVSDTTKRVTPNWLVVGKDLKDLLMFMGAPRFVPTAVPKDAVGPYRLGTFDGYMAVYYNPFFSEDQYLIGYKGNSFLDAGLVYAPYYPFFATEPFMLEDFLGRRGYASSGARKMVNPVFYVAGKIVKDIKGM